MEQPKGLKVNGLGVKGTGALSKDVHSHAAQPRSGYLLIFESVML